MRWMTSLLSCGVGSHPRLWSERCPSCRCESCVDFACKRWNSLFCDPEFGALWIQHVRQDSLFVVARYAINEAEFEGYLSFGSFGSLASFGTLGTNDSGSFGKEHGWSFQDVNARVWCTIGRDGQEVFDCFKSERVAMDGGLMCQFLDAEKENEFVSEFVSNPIAKTSRRLPSAPYYSATRTSAVVNLVVDQIAHNYKIFLMPGGDDGETMRNPRPMVVFESATNQWRSLTSLPKLPSGDDSCVRCSIFFDGLIYVLTCASVRQGAEEYWIWSYNYVKDAWEDSCVYLHSTALVNPQFIVSDNRLFLVPRLQKRINHACGKWPYEVSEVILGDQTRSVVFQMTSPEVAQGFCLRKPSFFHQ